MYDRLFQAPYVLRIFTDNVVIGWPIPDHPLHGDGESQLGHTFLNVAQYQLEMAVRGYLVRGGLAVGDLFMDDMVVFGPALVEAYRLESEVAVHPRVVLCDNAVRLARLHSKYYRPRRSAPQNEELLVDVDGHCFVDYLRAYPGSFDDPAEGRTLLRKQMLIHKERVADQLGRHEKNRRIWDKYAWVAKYHNHAAAELFPKEAALRIDSTLMNPPYASLLARAKRKKRASTT